VLASMPETAMPIAPSIVRFSRDAR
jgi:hypothetical protein